MDKMGLDKKVYHNLIRDYGLRSDHQWDYKSLKEGFELGYKEALELVKNNSVLDGVIVSAKDCRIPMREFNSDKCLICGKKFNEH